MLTKVYGGTAVQEGEALCDTCRHARIIRGRRLEEEVVFCDAMPMHPARVTFKVTSCTDYADSREPAFHEYLEKAWILCPGSKRRAAGFVRAAELKPEEMVRLYRNAKEEL
jgi:hypothetical protein